MINQVFELKSHSLSEQEITDDIRNVLKLSDKMLSWEVEFYCKELDDKTGIWQEDCYRHFYSRLLRSSIICVEVGNSTDEEGFWVVSVFQVSGHKIYIYFAEHDKAREIANAIAVWICS